MSKNMKYRENVLISLHPHNDRGCGISDAEMGLLAGADRIEGTLFGNGERTGNVDIVTLALNMYSQGVDPQLDFSDMPAISAAYEEYTGMHIDMRSPYGGSLYLQHSPVPIRMRSQKGMHYREEHDCRPGQFRTCRSIRPISEENMKQMLSVSTVSPEKAA